MKRTTSPSIKCRSTMSPHYKTSFKWERHRQVRIRRRGLHARLVDRRKLTFRSLAILLLSPYRKNLQNQKHIPSRFQHTHTHMHTHTHTHSHTHHTHTQHTHTGICSPLDAVCPLLDEVGSGVSVRSVDDQLPHEFSIGRRHPLGVRKDLGHMHWDTHLGGGEGRHWRGGSRSVSDSSTWSICRLGSGEITVLPEKSTRFPERLPRKRPCFPFSL